MLYFAYANYHLTVMGLQHALARQRDIYTRGMAGKRPAVPFLADDLRRAARDKLSRPAWDYIDGSAGDEQTAQANLHAFSAVTIRPRLMRNNESCDFSSTLFGTPLPFPMMLAPIGALDLIHPQADRMVAQACRHTGTPFVFSNQAGTPMEVCAQDMGDAPRWFQLYWSKSDELVLSFVRRAEACGCQGIVLTVDTTLLGWRSRDLALGHLPFLQGLGIAQYTSDDVFQRMLEEGQGKANPDAPKPPVNLATIASLLRQKRHYPGGFWKNLLDTKPLEAVRLFVNTYTNPALSWENVRWLRERTTLPILIKGLSRPDDVLKAIDSGADGVVVSNHGGRQVDGAMPSLVALRGIRREVPDSFPLLLDSGIRSGSDVFKAIALGARAVLIGRPYAYGLAINGRQGVEDVIANLANSFELTARLSGCRTLAEIGPDMVSFRE